MQRMWILKRKRRRSLRNHADIAVTAKSLERHVIISLVFFSIVFGLYVFRFQILVCRTWLEMVKTMCHCTSQHANSPESDNESRHKRHKRDHRDHSRRTGLHDELEDGELGEDGEIQQFVASRWPFCIGEIKEFHMLLLDNVNFDQQYICMFSLSLPFSDTLMKVEL